MNDDFNVRPLYPGSVVGLRSFTVDDGGKLAGVFVRSEEWTPGENTAKCVAGDWTGSYCGNVDWLSVILNGGSSREPHQVASLNARCGFYAYFDGSNQYANSDRVTGIVEGYGVTTIGNRGFRSSKARILALVAPDGLGGTFSRVRGNYPGVPAYPTVEAALEAHPLTKPEDLGIEPSPPPSYAQGGVVGVIGPWGSMGHVHLTMRVGVADFQKAMERAAAAARKAPAALEALKGITQADTPPDPVAKKKADAEARAEQRARAGLRNVGGIDRRQRRLS
jgi:hypothetical protein